MTTLRKARAALGLVFGLTALEACSLLEDLGADQCETKADCEALPFVVNQTQPFACVEHVCVPSEEPGCLRNEDCVGAMDEDDNLIPNPVCASIEPIEGCGPDAEVGPCIEQTCRSLTDGASCEVYGFEEGRENDLVVGVLAPGRATSDLLPSRDVVREVIRLVNQAGVAPGNEPVRRMVAVVCDSANVAVANRQAHRLVTDFGAQAIITAQPAHELEQLDLLREQGVPVPVIAINASNEAFAGRDPEDRLFHMVDDEDDFVTAGYMQLFENTLLPRLEQEHGPFTSDNALRILIVRPLNLLTSGAAPQDDTLQHALETSLGDAVAVEQTNRGDEPTSEGAISLIRRLEFGVAVDVDPDPNVEELASLPAHLVFSLIGDDIVRALEGFELCNRDDTVPRFGCVDAVPVLPTLYVLDHPGRTGDLWPRLASDKYADSFDHLPGRVFGIEHATQASAYQDLETRLGEAMGYEFLRDALVAVALAALHADARDPEGKGNPDLLAQGLRALGDGEGESIAITNTTDFGNARTRAETGELSMVGVTGPIAWTDRGHRELGITVNCVNGLEGGVQVGVSLDDVPNVCFTDNTPGS